MLVTRGQIEIRMGDATLAQKLDVTGALIAAILDGHRDTLSTAAWAAINRAQANIAEAMLAGEKPTRLQIGP